MIKIPNFAYLTPPDDAKNVQHSERYIHEQRENYLIRHIFQNKIYTEVEEERIRQVEDKIKQEKIILPNCWNKAKTLKYALSGKQGDLDSQIEIIKKHIDWINNPKMHQLNQCSLRFLTNGVFYIMGRDKQFRPIIVINIHLMDLKKNFDEQMQALSFLLDIVQKYMYLPGYVESQVVILETNGMGLLSIPFATIKKLIDFLMVNFTCSLERMYITNPSWIVNQIWKFCSTFVSQETLHKINFLQKTDFHKIQDSINQDNIEEKYGGSAPNLVSYWPFRPLFLQNIPNTQEISIQNHKNQLTEVDSDFFSITNNSEIFFNLDRQDFQGIDEKSLIYIDNAMQQQKQGCCTCNIF